MSRDRERVRTRFARWWFSRRVVKALLLNKRRRAIRMDGLSLRQYRNRLQIEWIAREVHPWNRDLPRTQIAELFAEQCLDDAGAAIDRLFRELPEVEFIDFTVLDPKSSVPILHGSVDRSDANAVDDRSSPGMKLKKLGVKYRLSNWQFEPLS
jgi:hypothetical protein